jgi:RNA 2',3'-cyclic 3'-phosphodiesterase
VKRLFVAAELPREVRDRLAAAAPGEPWRRVVAESLHVTLAFLCSRPEEDVGPVAQALERCAGAPIDASLGGGVLLPPRRPRVCTVRVVAPELETLQARVAHALAELGVYAPERRRFLPHVTVARTRRRPPPDAPIVTGRFVIDSVALFESIPSPAGSRYTALHRARLG